MDQYVAAVLAIADTEGLAAVSMRRVAGDLGSGTATLYRYIANRNELVDLIVDAAQGEDQLPEPAHDWRTDLAAVANALRATQLRHPWLAGELAVRFSLGPNSLRRSESALRAAVALTPDITRASRALGAVHAYVHGSVAEQQVARSAEQRTGLTRNSGSAASTPTSARSSRRACTPCSPAASTEPRNPTPTTSSRSASTAVLGGLAARLGR